MLLKLKDNSLKTITSAASSGDSRQVLEETARLSRIEVLIERQEALDKEVQALTTKTPQSDSRMSSPPERVSRSLDKDSPRKRGDKRRSEFIKVCDSKGFKLTPIKGALFQNARAETIGIAYASERKENGWFLGLPSQEFNHAVLLCENKNGKVFAICLPHEFFQKHEDYLSKSKGQTKFNVRLRTGHYFLTIPVIGSVQVDEYVDKPEHIA